MVRYSIIIPTFGVSLEQMQEVLNSVTRQSIPKEHYEVVIVDDGTPARLRADYPRLRDLFPELQINIILSPHNRGPAFARNIGIEAARGEILFFTDDDCEVPALWMQAHLNIYQQYPRTSAVGGWYTFQKNITSSNPWNFFQEMLYDFFFIPVGLRSAEGTLDQFPFNKFPAQNTANLSVRTSVAKALKGFDLRFYRPGSEDAEFSERLSYSGFSIYYIPFQVYHRKELTFRRLLKLARNRASGIYVRLMIIQKIFPNDVTALFREYLLRHASYKNSSVFFRARVRIAAAVFLFMTRSRLSMWIEGVRWRRKMKEYGYFN